MYQSGAAALGCASEWKGGKIYAQPPAGGAGVSGGSARPVGGTPAGGGHQAPDPTGEIAADSEKRAGTFGAGSAND